MVILFLLCLMIRGTVRRVEKTSDLLSNLFVPSCCPLLLRGAVHVMLSLHLDGADISWFFLSVVEGPRVVLLR